jgi:hypothetical protein
MDGPGLHPGNFETDTTMDTRKLGPQLGPSGGGSYRVNRVLTADLSPE